MAFSTVVFQEIRKFGGMWDSPAKAAKNAKRKKEKKITKKESDRERGRERERERERERPEPLKRKAVVPVRVGL